MRAPVLICLGMLVTGAAAQERAGDALPRKGDAVLVKGCLRGSALESADVADPEGDASYAGGLTFRLVGDKGVLKDLKQKHDGRVVEVRGVLKSELQPQGGVGGNLGRMRIRIGSPSPGAGRPDDEARRSIPVIDVKSFAGSDTRCAR